MKYAISKEGIESLNKLSTDLIEATEDIDNQAIALLEKVNGVEKEMGIFYKEVLMLSKEMLTCNKEAKEMVNTLARISIPKLISEIEMLMFF